MPSCEKCWRDSHVFGEASDPDTYQQLIKKRDASGHTCTLEQQAGEGDAKTCPKCNRATMHIYCHVCMACGYEPKITPEGVSYK